MPWVEAVGCWDVDRCCFSTALFGDQESVQLLHLYALLLCLCFNFWQILTKFDSMPVYSTSRHDRIDWEMLMFPKKPWIFQRKLDKHQAWMEPGQMISEPRRNHVPSF